MAMTLDQLILFIAVCETGSISGAAKRLFVSRQAASRSLSHFEEELGAPLIMRSSSGVEPTALGRYVYNQALTIDASCGNIVAAASQVRNEFRENIAAGLSYGVFFALGSDRFEEFSEKHPSIELLLSDEADAVVEDRVKTGVYDIGFGIEPIDRDEFFVFPVLEEKTYLRVFAGHELFNRESLKVDDLRNQKFVCPGSNQKYRNNFFSYCSCVGIDPIVVDTQSCCEFSTLELIAMRENALFSAPESIVRIPQPHVKSFEWPGGNGPRWAVAIIVKKDKRITPGIAALIDEFSK